MRRFRYHTIKLFLLTLPLLGALVACRREPLPEPAREAAVRLSLDTKAGDPSYAGTFRVALFDANNEFTGRTGSYCTTVQSHTDANTSATRTWLDPCKVDPAGNPLDGMDQAVALDNLAAADHNSVHGLRWGGVANYSVVNVSVAAVSPAVPIYREPAEDPYDPTVRPVWAYVTWTPSSPLYISDPRTASFTGSWLDGEYVYTSSSKVSDLVDRRASVTVHIECGELDEGDIQSVTLNNRMTTARYYLMAKTPYAKGFSWADGHYTTGAQPLYSCGAGSPLHLDKSNGDHWDSEKIYFPDAPFSDNTLEPIRPEFVIMLGADKAKPFKARVVLNQDLSAMTHYTLKLLISKAVVHATLTASATWDAGGTMTTLDDSALNVGTFSVEAGWNDGGSHDATDVDTAP